MIKFEISKILSDLLARAGSTFTSGIRFFVELIPDQIISTPTNLTDKTQMDKFIQR